jgi:hypothetical protein
VGTASGISLGISDHRAGLPPSWSAPHKACVGLCVSQLSVTVTNTRDSLLLRRGLRGLTVWKFQPMVS